MRGKQEVLMSLLYIFGIVAMVLTAWPVAIVGFIAFIARDFVKSKGYRAMANIVAAGVAIGGFWLFPLQPNIGRQVAIATGFLYILGIIVAFIDDDD